MSNKIDENVNSLKKTLIFDKVLREELLTWVNNTLQAKFNKIEELCTGAAYCQLLHAIFPTAISIKRVKFITNLEHECFENFKILQKAFEKLGIKKSVPVSRLCKARYQENLEFLAWFRKFYMANDNMRNRFYDAMAMRNGMPMKYGPVEVRNIYEKRAKEAIKGKLSLPQAKMSMSQRNFEKSSKDELKTKSALSPKFRASSQSLERSATKTLMKHRRLSSLDNGKQRMLNDAASMTSSQASQASQSSSKTNSIVGSHFEFSAGGGDARYDKTDSHSQSSAHSTSVSLKRTATRTLIKANKAGDDIVSVQFPSPVTSDHKDIVRQQDELRQMKIATENEIVMLRNKLIDAERMMEQKNRLAFELELELTKTQNEVNEMQMNLRRARQERDNYFDKIRKVTMCCRSAQCNAELSISVSEIMKIFLADSNLL